MDQGEAVVAPLKAFAPPVLDLWEPKPYVEHQAVLDPSFPHDWWYHMRGCDVAELSDEVIDITVDHATRIQSRLTGSEPAARGRGRAETMRARSTAAAPGTPTTSPA